jgi:hypothetical protein
MLYNYPDTLWWTYDDAQSKAIEIATDEEAEDPETEWEEICEIVECEVGTEKEIF